MIELAALALLQRLTNLGFEPVIATRTVAADLATLRAFAADPALYGAAARVRRSGASIVVARVRFGPRAVLRYTWILSPSPGSTEVDLALQLESRGIVYRLAMLLGGRRVVRRRLDASLARMARAAVCVAEDLDLAPAPAPAVAWPHAA